MRVTIVALIIIAAMPFVAEAMLKTADSSTMVAASYASALGGVPR